MLLHPMRHGIETDLALWRGWAVFEAIEARGTTLFHWDDHYERLVQSCHGAWIPEPSPSVSLKQAVQKELRIRSYTESLVKILITRGRSENHTTPIEGTTSVLIDILPLPKRSPRPLKLEVQRGIREFPHIKLTGGYGYTMIRGEIAAFRGHDDFLFSSPETGITESSIGNIFFIWNIHPDKSTKPILGTPHRDILNGVTRRIVLGIAKKSDVFLSINDTTFIADSSVFKFSEQMECFITSTTYGVHPVENITDLNGVTHQFKIGSTTVTEKLKTLFLEYHENYFAKHGA